MFMNYSVREISNTDVPRVVSYFLDAETRFLHKMGVDISKLPERDIWIEKIKNEIEKPVKEKEFYYIIWLINNEPVGRSNISHIHLGESAKFHLGGMATGAKDWARPARDQTNLPRSLGTFR